MNQQLTIITIQVDPLRAAQVLDLKGAADAMNIRGLSAKTIKDRILENPIWAKYFWQEGPDYRTSLGNVLALQSELAKHHAEIVMGVAA